MSWNNIEFFRAAEFASPDKPDSGVKMRLFFVARLDELRRRCGFPLLVSSGYRTAAHNKKVGGVDSSAHTKGWAADIRCFDSKKRLAIVRHALDVGFRRIGLGSTFVHLDDSPDHPSDVMWLY